LTNTHKQRWAHAFVLTLAAAAASCAAEPGWQAASISAGEFEDEVYPVLLRDCAFSTCHGAEERYFRIWGPGRVRLDPLSVTAFTAATADELTTSYQRTLSMVDAKDPSSSLLLRKPLATAAGGAGHLGADKLGRNVYRSVDDHGYLVLSRWVYSVVRQ
jgi:hypothetical protein